jgi:hypothetical protein
LPLASREWSVRGVASAASFWYGLADVARASRFDHGVIDIAEECSAGSSRPPTRSREPGKGRWDQQVLPAEPRSTPPRILVTVECERPLPGPSLVLQCVSDPGLNVLDSAT